MKPCPSCGYIVPAAWTECRRCGAALAFASSSPPAPSASTATTLAALALAPPPPTPLPGARQADAGLDTMLPQGEPVIRLAPARAPSRMDARTIAIIALAIVIVVAGVYSLLPRGGHHAAEAPTILPPEAASAGIPTSLSAVVRIAAESARHTALSTVITAAASGAPVTLTQLASAQPSYQWVPGDQASTTNTIVSFASAPTVDVVAVSGTSRDVCAFGRWSVAAGSEYVTMAHVPSCSANAAPTTGWTQEAGGSAEDLPGENGL